LKKDFLIYYERFFKLSVRDETILDIEGKDESFSSLTAFQRS
jgi:hypothetical protein